MKRDKRLMLCMFGALALANGSAARAEELVDVLRRVLETNPEVEASKWERLAVGEQVRQAKAGYLPNINLSAGVGREGSDNTTTRALGEDSLWLTREERSLTLTQMLFDGFETANRVEQVSAQHESADYRLHQTAETTSLRAVEAYLDVLRRQKLIELNRQNVETHENRLQQVTRGFEGGAGRKADVKQTESRLALARSNLVQAEGNLRDAEARYIRVVGEAPSQPQTPVPPIDALPADLEAALDEAVANSSAVMAAARAVDAAQAGFEQTRAGFLPKLQLDLGVTDNTDVDGVAGQNDDVVLMLRGSYNLYRGGADSARRSEAAFRLNRAKEELTRTQRAVAENVRLSWNALQNVRRRLDDLRRQVKSSESVRESYRRQFTLGQRTLLDLLDSENELFTARAALVTAQFTERFAVYRVLASVDNMLETLGIVYP